MSQMDGAISGIGIGIRYRLYGAPYIILRYALRKKLRDYLGIFPKWRTPPPIPPFGNPLFEEKKIIVYFAF